MSPESVLLDLPTDHLEVANERKLEGNECFRQNRWADALVAYRSALNCLPKRKDQATSSENSKPDPPEASEPDHAAATPEAMPEITSPALSDADKECVKLRAILHANVGACLIKLGDHKGAVESCSQALLDNPVYIKALERRASSNEVVNSWSSLTSAQEDYNTLLKLVPPSQIPDLRRKIQCLKPRLETAQKAETDEMLNKLKGLGNSLLGNFGLSTDNFKFEPNGQGGYSVNFSR